MFFSSAQVPLNPQGSSVPQEEQVVIPDPSSAYADLGEVEPVNLISFAYQIASGMVSGVGHWCIYMGDGYGLVLYIILQCKQVHVSGSATECT